MMAHTGLSGLGAAGMTASFTTVPRSSRLVRGGFSRFQTPTGIAASIRLRARYAVSFSPKGGSSSPWLGLPAMPPNTAANGSGSAAGSNGNEGTTATSAREHCSQLVYPKRTVTGTVFRFFTQNGTVRSPRS